MELNAAPRRTSFAVSKGSVKIKVYPLRSRQWQVCYYAPEGRVRKTFSDRTEAEVFAKRIAGELASQTSHALTLEPREAAVYRAALSLLPHGATLISAVEYYAARHLAGAPRMPVKEAVQTLLADLEARGLSTAHKRAMGGNLTRFAESFKCPLSDVTAELLRSWLGALNLGPATLGNYRKCVVALFNFAADRKWVTADLAREISKVATPKVIVGNVHTFTAAELHAILSACSPEELPAVALLAFCPLRASEVARLDWRDVQLGERVVIVNARHAKLNQRRVVPIPEAALEWIGTEFKTSGPLWHVQPDPDGDLFQHRLPILAKEAGVKYGQNALRHSCISALVALHDDPAKVAHWAGNSPQIISSNYNSRWTRSQAEAWFAVRPSVPANVVAMEAAA